MWEPIRMNKLSNKKVLFVVSQLKVGGAAKMIKYVANLCAAHFGKVALLTYYDDYTPDDLNTSIERVNLNVKAGGVPLWRIKAFRRLRRCIKAGAYDLVCSFLPDVSLMSRLATFGIDTVVVSAERGDPYQFSRLWRKLVSWTYRKSDYCIFQLDRARDFFGEGVASHSFVIPNPYVPEKNVSPFKGSRKKTIVSAGRFAPQKRFDVLLEAFATVHSVCPDYRLILYGVGECLAEYQAQVKELGICESVSFPGYVRGIPSAIREDGIFVLSSDYEGIPNSLIEAMSVGLPVVSTDCSPGGAAFLTDGGNRGLLVPVHDVKAMAEAILKLIKDPGLAQMMSERAMEVVGMLDAGVIDSMWIDSIKTMLEKNESGKEG